MFNIKVVNHDVLSIIIIIFIVYNPSRHMTDLQHWNMVEIRSVVVSTSKQRWNNV